MAKMRIRLKRLLSLIVPALMFYIFGRIRVYRTSPGNLQFLSKRILPPDIAELLMTPCKMDKAQFGMIQAVDKMRDEKLEWHVDHNVLKSTSLVIAENRALLKTLEPLDEDVGKVLPHYEPEDSFYDPSLQQIMKLHIIPRFFANYTTPGTFFESGALDTEYRSMTYYLERRLGWRGVLVEPNPDKNPLENALKHRRHNVFVASACVAPGALPCQGKLIFTDKPHANRTLVMEQHPSNSDGVNLVEKFPQWPRSTNMRFILNELVNCYPLQTFIKAAGFTSLDFLSLDIGAIDLSALTAFPWNEIPIKVVRLRTARGATDMDIMRRLEFMKIVGYIYHKDLTLERSRGNEYFFQKENAYQA